MEAAQLANVEQQLLAAVFRLVEQVAPLDTPVLLLGEPGTSQEIVARAIHSRSARHKRPLIRVNCAALPAAVMEAELFGRERGSGDGGRQIGRFEMAHRGTIFLEEIGALPLNQQDRLLRVMRYGEFKRQRCPRAIPVDVRILAASNRHLEEEVRNGRFREDLFRLLSVLTITIPPLAQRKQDIPRLVEFFVAKFNGKYGKQVGPLPEGIQNVLQEYPWPGNLLELESVIERAVITTPEEAVQDLNRRENSRGRRGEAGLEAQARGVSEHDRIVEVLGKTGGRIEGKNGAAEFLGLHPSTLRGRMRKYGILRRPPRV
ncbi:sigma 54-interacting transcriptional regulator [Geomesophilobacter sediminis]|uniref:Sigma-54-dependent Fis family transcriptional regulator n=1 Tax=Geomesophilobacter sediminis TaxID=2798584 RepID=A0A8J7J369_9BACT|nr:sigma 54-interacting transcriptional regulator [Geomesophilobacter sediminis]MBJ6725233.1 sigma-54-dependent Fis family transcriptional regulator [Geomesophilobacter sediminis]